MVDYILILEYSTQKSKSLTSKNKNRIIEVMKELKVSRKFRIIFMLAVVAVTIFLVIIGRKPYQESFSEYYEKTKNSGVSK